MNALNIIKAGLLWFGALISFSPLQAAEARVNQVYETTCSSCALQQQSVTLSAPIPSLSSFRFISQNPADATFSGNNLKGTLVYTNQNNTQVVIYGILSRLIRSGSNNLAVYLAETDNSWTTPTGKGYVLTVPGQESTLAAGMNFNTSSNPLDVVMNDPILPVTGMNLRAYRSGTTAFLNWEVIAENNTESYIVERSTDGQRFSALGKIAALGSVSGNLSYKFTDQPNLSKAVFYRIKAIDIDGRLTSSKIVSVNFGQSRGGYELYPNPAKSAAYLSFDEAGDFSIQLLNATGTLLRSLRVSATGAGAATTLHQGNLPPGMYLLQITNSNSGGTSSKRLMFL